MQTGFELRGVTKTYAGRTVLQDVTLQLPRGAHTAIFGPSGSGKSTLLKLLAGLDAPTSGQVLLDGAVLSGDGKVHVPPRKRGVSMVFQDLALWPNLTGRENVLLGLAGLRISRSEKVTRAKQALTLCDADSVADRRPGEMSGGEQQRIALARAIATQATYLFLDEPFAGVDLELRFKLLDEISRLTDARNFTMVLVTHDPFEAIRLCPAIARLEGGAILSTGRTRDILLASCSPFNELTRQLAR